MSDPLDRARARIARIHPEAGPACGLTLLGEGFGATLLVSPSGLVIRIPKTPVAAGRLQVVANVLPLLAPRLPTPIPAPVWRLEPDDDLLFGALAYQRLEGVPLALTTVSGNLAGQVGEMLAALHGIDPIQAGIDLGGVPRTAEVDAAREEAMRTCLRWLRHELPGAAAGCLERWWDAYRATRAARPFAPSIIHGDLWPENLLADPERNRLTGVLDWDDLAYDDPAQDLATLLHAGPMFANRVLWSYASRRKLNPRDLLSRRAWHWGFREFTGLAAALRNDNEPELRDAMTKLCAGPLQRCFNDEHTWEDPRHGDDTAPAPASGRR